MFRREFFKLLGLGTAAVASKKVASNIQNIEEVIQSGQISNPDLYPSPDLPTIELNNIACSGCVPLDDIAFKTITFGQIG